MLDIFNAFLQKIKSDNSSTDPKSLKSLVGPRFLEPTFMVQVNPTQVDVTTDLPRGVYFGSNSSTYLDKNELVLVVSVYAKKYNECVAICNRITELIYSPFSYPGTSAPTLKPKESIIGVITKQDNEEDSYNQAHEVYERTLRFNIKYVRKC